MSFAILNGPELRRGTFWAARKALRIPGRTFRESLTTKGSAREEPKMGRTSLRGLLSVLTLAVILVGKVEPALAQAKKSDSVVKVEVTADKPDAEGKQTLT